MVATVLQARSPPTNSADFEHAAHLARQRQSGRFQFPRLAQYALRDPQQMLRADTVLAQRLRRKTTGSGAAIKGLQ